MAVHWLVLVGCTLITGTAFGTYADFHYLAADPSLRAQTHNANAVMGQAKYVGKVLELDQPWESPFKLLYPGSVVVDPATGQWRMYYEVMKSEEERFAAMATSSDGVHWTKPELNVTGTTYTADRRNNFINAAATWINGPSVFVDANAPADQRYRMCERAGLALYADASADGINWRRVGVIDDAPGNYRLDSQNTAFWDPKSQQYLSYMRWWYSSDGVAMARRGVMTKRSADFDTAWAGEREFTIDPKDIAGITSMNRADIYCPGVMPYKGQYIGLPTMYYHPEGQSDGAVYPTFMVSRNGTDWSFQDPYHAMIDLSAHGQDEVSFGQAYMMSSLPERNGELYLYYSYFAQQHESPATSGQIHLAKLREDRFVGIQSTAGSVGTWTTPAVTLGDDPGELLVNAVVEGSLTVELLDPTTLQPLAGYALADGIVIGPGDYLDARAGWSCGDDLRALAGRQVVLRFVMDDATVYSFHFQPAPEPSTIVLLGTGLAGLLAYMWKKRKTAR